MAPEIFDPFSYGIGKQAGQGEIIINGSNTVYTDDGEGNITITVSEEADD